MKRKFIIASFFAGFPQVANNAYFEKIYSNMRNNQDHVLIVGGDFNSQLFMRTRWHKLLEKELDLKEVSYVLDGKQKFTRIGRYSKSQIDYLYVSSTLLKDVSVEFLDNMMSDHRALLLSISGDVSEKVNEGKKFYQVHPAIRFTVDNVNDLYILMADAITGFIYSAEKWYALKIELDSLLKSWNKLFALNSRTELRFLMDMAEDPSSCRELSQHTIDENKKRLDSLNNDNLKLLRTIFVRNMRIPNSELSILIKTHIFHALKPGRVLTGLVIDSKILTGMEMAVEINLFLANSFNGSAKSILGYSKNGIGGMRALQEDVMQLVDNYFNIAKLSKT